MRSYQRLLSFIFTTFYLSAGLLGFAPLRDEGLHAIVFSGVIDGSEPSGLPFPVDYPGLLSTQISQGRIPDEIAVEGFTLREVNFHDISSFDLDHPASDLRENEIGDFRYSLSIARSSRDNWLVMFTGDFPFLEPSRVYSNFFLPKSEARLIHFGNDGERSLFLAVTPLERIPIFSRTPERLGGEGLLPPKIADRQAPEYPQDLEVRPAVSQVRLQAIVSQDGTVEAQDTLILTADDPLLARNALQNLVDGTRFEPASRGGGAVSVLATFDFSFQSPPSQPQEAAQAQESKLGPQIGAPAPPIDFEQILNGPSHTEVNWDNLRGKVVVLEFWATWCGPCVEGIAHLNELISSLEGQPVQFIFVTDEDEETVRPFMEKQNILGWVGLDRDQSVLSSHKILGIPMTVLVDREGVVRDVTNPTKVTEEALRSLLQ